MSITRDNLRNQKEIDRLKNRWTRDIINLIVVALNEGHPISDIIIRISLKDSSASGDCLDMRGIDLSHQNLRGPWITKEMRRSRCGINLKNANMTGANLSWAILPRADLRNVILVNADLSCAELIFADFSGADLTGANFKGAWLWNTKFLRAKIDEEQLQDRRSLGQLDFDYRAYEL